MDKIKTCADASIRRGIGFGFLAIATAMVGVGHEWALAVQGGAIMVMIMWTILLFKALRAPRADYRSTEVWTMLDRKFDEIPRERLQAVIGSVLRERYLWHAEIAALIALTLWLIRFALLEIG